jgi:gluconate 2-dehydrogenase gamma chain
MIARPLEAAQQGESMSTKGKSRRAFLIDSATGLNAAWVTTNYLGILAAQQYVMQAAETGKLPKLAFFTDDQAVEVEAIAAQIIPTDDTPGAREAHCVYFIDRALTTFERDSQPLYTQGLQDLQAKTKELYPDASKFSALTAEQQIKTLTAIEKTKFFNTVRTHTVIGFLARPEHGGNYEKVGWKLIGYDGSLKHKPPFGYYDAQPQPRRKA